MARFGIAASFTAIDRITKPITRMQRRVKKFARLSSMRIAKMGKVFLKAGAFMGKAMAAGAGVAAIAVGALISKTAALGDEVGKTSRMLGIGAEELQELRFAADRQGVASKTLDSGFLALQKRVGELRSGTGALYTFLNKTGDKAFARQLINAKDTGEAFDLMTKKASEIKNPLDKAAFAAAAFSRGGIKMLKFMEAGAEGIKKLREEANKYGAVMSTQATQESETFIDSLTNLKSSLGGIGRTFAGKLIPFVSDAMQKFADFWALNKDIINAGMDKFLSFLGNTFRAIKPGVVALFQSVKQLFGAFFEAVSSILPEFNTEADDLSDGINTLTGGLKFLADIGVKAFQFIKNISPFLKPLITTLLIYQGLVIAIALVTKGWAIVQGILNAVMAINPVTLIILGIIALIVIIVMLVKNWDAVVAAFQTGAAKIWDFLSGLLDNPFIAAIGTIFLPFITIPALIIKHWEPIKAFFIDTWNSISEIFTQGIDFITTAFSLVSDKLIKDFEPVKAFFIDTWNVIMGGIKSVTGFVSGIAAKFGITIGGEKEEETEGSPGASPAGQVITRSEQTRRTIEESRQTSTAELLIRDETGRGELRRNQPAGGVKIAMASSGGM